MHSLPLTRGWVALLLLASGLVVPVRGDVFQLAGGGRVEGRISDAESDDRLNVIIELSAGGRLTVPRSQITRIQSIDAEYAKRSRTAPDTVEAHLELAEWCRDNRLRDEMQQHYARILELDPNHEEARGVLGFRRKDGEWMTRDDVMDSRGMVLYEGRYVSPQHVELLDRQKQTKAEKADWSNTLQRLRRWLTGRRQERVADALAEVRQIRDPLAAEALVNMLEREDDPALLRLWIEVAARLNHRDAVDALVNLSLNHPDPEIRRDCLEYLVQSGRPGLMTPYIRVLKNSDNVIVNRAAAALGLIGDRDAMGPLIDALVTKHKFTVGDGNANQHAYTFSPDSGAFSFGGGGPQVVTQPIRNPAALSALVNLSGGTSFDYDQQQWRRWLAAQAKRNAIDVRRDE